jgi:hypothetical protein
MNARSIRFRCPKCSVRINAPVQLGGRNRSCPGCGHTLLVPRMIPEDVGTVLVVLESEERFSLGIAPRAGAAKPYPARRSA